MNPADAGQLKPKNHKEQPKMLMTVDQFQTKTSHKTVHKRGSLAAIDLTLKQYHEVRLHFTPGVAQLTVLEEMFKMCKDWLKKKEKNSDNVKMGMFETNYLDEGLLASRNAVKDLGCAALDEIFSILRSQGVLDAQKNGQISFDKNKLQMLATGRNRPELKSLEKPYQLERTMYIESKKQTAVSGTCVVQAHEALKKNGNLQDYDVKQLSREDDDALRKALGKDVEKLSRRDWEILDAVSRMSTFAGNDVIYKRKKDRVTWMVTPGPAGKLFDASDRLFSTRVPGASPYAMDQYGNLFIEPPTFSPGSKCLNHSSFNCGNDVICAGNIIVQSGVLLSIDNASGHYKPTQENLYNCVRMLNDHGVELRNTQVMVYKGPSIPAAKVPGVQVNQSWNNAKPAR